MLTTLTSYGTVPDHRQADLIRRMSSSPSSAEPLDDADAVQLIAALARKVGNGSMPLL